MNKLLLYVMLCCCLASWSVCAATTIQLLASKTSDAVVLSHYLMQSINDVNITTGQTINLEADLVIVLSQELAEKLPSERPATLFVLPQPIAIKLQKQDSALYWTPSLAMQLNLIKAILPATHRVGMLVGLGNEEQSWLGIFKQYAKEQGIEVLIKTVDKSRIGRQVSELAVSTDVLLAQPDAYIYNRETIRFILLAAYRQNKALIGPSLAFVNAGSLATLYAASSTVNQEIAQWIDYFIKQKKLPNVGRIKKVDVALNAQVAKSLGVQVLSTQQLQANINVEELPLWP